MRYIDLTHKIREDMPVYPGTEKPKLKESNTIEKDHFRETLLSMYSHTGTHTDSPAHLFTNGKSLDEFQIAAFCGRAVVLDCTGLSENSRIGKDMLLSLGEKLERADFLVIKTGWEKYWNSEKYFSGFPCIDAEAAQLLVKSGKKGMAVDAISVDPVGEELEVHKILLGSDNFIIVENLCNLDCIHDDEFEFFALPLKFENADGAPTRVVAQIR